MDRRQLGICQQAYTDPGLQSKPGLQTNTTEQIYRLGQGWAINFPEGPHEKLGPLWWTEPIG